MDPPKQGQLLPERVLRDGTQIVRTVTQRTAAHVRPSTGPRLQRLGAPLLLLPVLILMLALAAALLLMVVVAAVLAAAVLLSAWARRSRPPGAP